MVAYGSNIKYKSRLVSKGFSQVQIFYSSNTFALVAKMESIRLVLAIVASKRWEVHHMDMKNYFIHGDIHDEICMKNRKVFIHYNSLCCSLKNYLYGLKQSPRAWYAKMDNFMLSLVFERCKYDNNVYL